MDATNTAIEKEAEYRDALASGKKTSLGPWIIAKSAERSSELRMIDARIELGRRAEERLWGLAQFALVPPLALLAIGAAFAWAFAGFRKQEKWLDGASRKPHSARSLRDDIR